MLTTGAYSHDRMTLDLREGPVTFTVRPEPAAGPIPGRLFGNFLEHLGFATQGGILAQALDNPTLTIDDHLSPGTRRRLLQNGQTLEQIAAMETEAARAAYGTWRPQGGGTGFSLAALGDMRDEQIPFPWMVRPAALAQGGEKGRIGHSVRLTPLGGEALLYQGVFLAQHRCLTYTGHLFARASSPVRLAVRLAKRPTGEALCSAELDCPVGKWGKLPFRLILPEGALRRGEPVDFQIAVSGEGAAYIDRACLFPEDQAAGFDPEMLALAQRYAPPILRGPGGNFVSGYHFWHGIGDVDLRQTFANPAWEGIETNFFGVDEFLRLCELMGSEPQLVINLGDGIPEEAAAWVEYVNGPADSPWGAKRAANGHPEPYGVKLWEVGNEIYGQWQVGCCGDSENARRYRACAAAMRAVDPAIELMGNGTEFDFFQEDFHWNRTLMAEGGDTLDCITLHALPSSDDADPCLPLSALWESLQAQPSRWEAVDIPQLLDTAAEVLPGRRMQAAITEWGILGGAPRCPGVANSGGSVFAASFYNACMRMMEHIRVTNATALFHGGCLRKVGAYFYVDPQVAVMDRYAALSGGTLYPMAYAGPAYQVRGGAKAIPAADAVPYVDGACVRDAGGGWQISLVNRHPERDLPVQLDLSALPALRLVSCQVQAAESMNAVNTPLSPEAVSFADHPAQTRGGIVSLTAPARGVVWLRLEA